MSVTSEEIRYVGKLECQMNIRISLHENVTQISDVPPGGKYLQKNDREFNQFAEIAIPPRIEKKTHDKSEPENMLEVEGDLKPYEHINM